MLLSGAEIRTRGILHPHYARSEIERGHRKFSFGEGPCGYDVRIEFDHDGKIPRYLLRPGEFILASTMEYFAVPPDVAGLVKDKSSWARRGLSVFNTVIEPGWRGYLTLELVNHGPKALWICLGDPIAQVVFELVFGTVQPYEGKYQDQLRGPQDAK